MKEKCGLMSGKQDWRKKFMTRCDFIEEIYLLTTDYDGDGNGLCGESYEEVVDILKKDYPTLFEAYKMLEEIK